jgi:serine/threonine protein kinase
MASQIRWDDLTLIRKLGEGQAGQVWLATTNCPANGVPAGQKVAVKRYKRWILEEPGQYKRVFRELMASIKVRHPHVVNSICLVLDQDHLPALVMKYYEGQTLESVLATSRRGSGRLPIPEAFRILGALIEGVEALHAADIYHRDLKPANILVDEKSGSPIIMDLGVVSDFLLAEQTQTKDFLGTIRYADPNYLAGNGFTAESDWYSVGLIGFELFFGTPALGSEEHWARIVAQKVLNKLPSHDDIGKQCENLSGLMGQDAAEAVFYTLSTLLFKCTPENLQRVRRAISQEFWLSPFFELPDGDVVIGEPTKIPSFRGESLYSNTQIPESAGTLETLQAAKDRLLAALDSVGESSMSVAGHVKRRYWNWRTRGADNIYDLEARSLESYWIYAGGSGDDTVYDHIYINAGIVALYRYGYV